MPTIRSCLEHRHSYVRRNAVMAIFTIFKNFDFLIPDAPELIANFLEAEQVTVLTDLHFSSLVVQFNNFQSH
jgi:vesicle coat complex subunit